MPISQHEHRMFDGIDGDIADLYEIVEVQKQQAVPSAVARDALRLINPNISSDNVDRLVRDNDGLGNGSLRRLEFESVVRHAIHNVDLAEASQLLRDLVFRMRVAFRRRYLMYEASPNTAPDFIFENVTTSNNYRIVFDLLANGADWINRAQLKELLSRILPEDRSAVSSACKAAMGPSDRPNSIGFAEFAMVLHPITQIVPLSTLAERAAAASRAPSRADAGGSSYETRDSLSSNPRPGAWLEELKERHFNAPPTASSTGRPSRSSTPILTSIKADMPSYRLASEAAAMRIDEALQSKGAESRRYTVGVHSASPSRGRSIAGDSMFMPSSPLGAASQTAANVSSVGAANTSVAEANSQKDMEDTIVKLREELARAKLEIVTLTREVHNATISNAVVESKKGTRTIVSSQIHSGGEALKGGKEKELLDDPFYRISVLEKELKETKMRLSISSDSQDLYNLLIRSNSTQPLARFYTGEKALLSKHEYLRSVSDMIDPQSPQFTLLSQYELLVCSYQALYRQAADKARAVSPSFGGAADVSAISSLGLARSLHRSPGRRSPSHSSRAGRPSASNTPTVAGLPFKWSEIDQPVSKDHWRTRTIGDPTLTEEERNMLRQKLAAQMRSVARSRSPHLKVKHFNPNMHYSSRATSLASSHVPPSLTADGIGVAVGGSRSPSRAAAGRPNLPASVIDNQLEIGQNKLTSQETMQRLQALSQIAAKQRFL